MNEKDRGIIRNRDFKRQIMDFRGLRWGKITPTDIDCFIEFGDKLFIIAEAKYNLKKMPKDGQQLAIERLCDASNNHRKGRHCYAMYLTHNICVSNDVDFSKLSVFMWRFGGKWMRPIKPIIFLDAVNILKNKHLLA